MIQHLIPLIIVFLIQESVSTSAVVLLARRDGVSWIDIHVIWLLCTIVSIVVPYYIGALLLRHKKIEKRFDKINKKGKRIFGKYGITVGLLLLGFFNYTVLNGLLAALLKLPLKYALLLFIIGDLFWYLGIIGINLVSVTFFHEINTILAAVVGLSLLITISSAILYKEVQYKNGKKK